MRIFRKIFNESKSLSPMAVKICEKKKKVRKEKLFPQPSLSLEGKGLGSKAPWDHVPLRGEDDKSENVSLSCERAKNFKEEKKMRKEIIRWEWKSLLLQLAGLTAGMVLVLAYFQSHVFAGDIENKLSTSNGTTAFQIKDSAGNVVSQVDSIGRAGIGTTSPKGKLHILSNSTTEPYVFVTSHTVSGFGIVVSTGGNVGNGTTDPAEKLEVSGNIKLSGASATYKITNVADPTANQDVATKAYVDASATIYITTLRGATSGEQAGGSFPTPFAPTEWTTVTSWSFSTLESDPSAYGYTVYTDWTQTLCSK